MHDWFKVSLLLCIFGFLKELRPSEPFIYEFLIDQRWRNLTEEQVNQEVYPVGTYSYLAHLIVIFLITDLCRYKPLIVLLGASGIVIWGMLLWTETLLELQILEIFYGTFCATEVAYYTYIYAKVDTEYFQQVSGHTRAAILAGRAVSGIIAQLLISFHAMNYRDLNYITFAAMIAATIWSLFLPSVKKSIYFHREEILSLPFCMKVRHAFVLMGNHFINSFSNLYVLKWSLWFALSTCGYIQAQTYMQPLWTAIVNDPEKSIYNGAVEALLTVLGFLGALLAGILNADWKTKGELTLTLCSLLQGFFLLYSARTEYILLSYIFYIVFGALYHFMVTIASSEIAKNIKDESYGLVFGINTFVAVVFQSILTTIVVRGGIGFALNPRDQYFVYGCFHIVVAVLYIIIGLITWLANYRYYRRASMIITS
ncbi:thiamine transporter 1-like [Anoplophora glabripennis]|uniref:thiamine transporter 1-like n=1 Tax=Anoplophora glabripennis TaxID=217634 RepID=UPI00087415BB|nr:thiamine transporter 1-like [Anoplophora glabripennis]